MPDLEVPPSTRGAAKWVFPEAQSADIEKLVQGVGISAIAAAILTHRGYTDTEDALAFLKPDLTSLHDPYLIKDMERAVSRLESAIQRQEPILLYGDYDVDGTCSIVVLKTAIEILGGSADFHIPDRLKEGYGMRSEVVEKAATAGIRLIVSVDTGIRASEVVRHANSLGIDVIVTDHHLPETELPPAHAVLNPNRPDCSYPNKYLCGAGVVLKLVQALFGHSNLASAKKAALLDSFLKPVAIATVADIVPLTGENRAIVTRGLAGLSNVKSEGLRALMNVAGLSAGDTPSAHQVAFRLAPRINAAGRMATAKDVIELFLTRDSVRASELAERLDLLNRDRQQTESTIVESILAECESIAPAQMAVALVFAGTEWHPGVLGIVASRLVERFGRPVFVLSEASGSAASDAPSLCGSGRSISAFHLLEALESMGELFVKFGGHRQAAGLTLSASALVEFRSRLNEYASTRLTAEDFRPLFRIDAVVSLDQLNDCTVSDIFLLGPFGFGNPAPLLCATDVEVAGPCRVLSGGKHLDVPLKQKGRVFMCKAWNCGEKLNVLPVGARVDVVFQIEDDAYSRKRGGGSWCLSLKDFRPASAEVSS